MNKLNKKEIREIIEKLKPFWNQYRRLQLKFSEDVENLRKEMNTSLDLGIKLEFFYVEGECVGIGAENYSDRENFPLIHDGELDEWDKLKEIRNKIQEI